MFLGGSLDHTIRDLAVDPDNPTMPRDDSIKVPTRTAGEENYLYLRHKVDTDPRRHTWWVFVLKDHPVTPRDLLDACPQLIL